MSHTPLRSRSSLGSGHHTTNATIATATNTSMEPTGTGIKRMTYRPPSRRASTHRPASPAHPLHLQLQTQLQTQLYSTRSISSTNGLHRQNSFLNPQEIRSRSRPGSSLGVSRPSTPVNGYQRQQEPYTGHISVSIRPNPHSYTENCQGWLINEYTNTITNSLDGTTFQFDHVFPPNDLSLNNNYEVYRRTCRPVVEQFLEEGYNGTVFAYGMTGSGKTYSMKGSDTDLQSTGFVELAINDLFSKIERMNEMIKYQVHISYLEIYNERIIDLLSTASTTSNHSFLSSSSSSSSYSSSSLSSSPSSSSLADLKIRDDPEYGVKVIGLTTAQVTSKEQILSLIKRGDMNRKTSATDFNAHSSRSHSILQIKLSKVDLLTNLESWATLSLCDLAGSERASSSLERRKEGSYINKSLLALSNVINKLSQSSNLAGYANTDMHISYRDSKLTRLLQPALSGKSLVLILCTIHMGGNLSSNNNNGINSGPTNSVNTMNQSVSETYKTLRFAARAKNIITNVEKNSIRSEYNDLEVQRLIRELNNTIELQKQELMVLKAASTTNVLSPPPLLNTSQLQSASSSAATTTTNNNNNNNNNDTLLLVEQELRAENKILMDKVEHLTRLTDLQRTETIIIKDNVINDIIGSGATNAQLYLANIEEYFRRSMYEAQNHKMYIEQLENQLKNHYISNPRDLAQTNKHVSPSVAGANIKEDNEDDANLLDVLKEQEGEIMQLKEVIKDKDHIIKSFTKSSRMRKLADSSNLGNVGNTLKNSYCAMDLEYKLLLLLLLLLQREQQYQYSSSRSHGDISKGKESSGHDMYLDKENEPMMAVDVKLSPKRLRSSFDII
ncbi:conserved hypothetical protein [Lodderomyces elongisporus NRRL YB-4239]|uniref:Kinesin-like protein n=1 Tax=Lodderomyces elongisporus (strain ATCC 11503 / CBS 2605 / JCM 1781 / NBRC 1676 / NRRL YB-4239) TaxID=379508 RepID=A5DYT5_LODEL|nr:conserved hypothetical protein [Lodderomyces elongisporus NRRL YB-4239]